MPEYSTPKLTPAETTKLTGMNSGSSGYFEVKDVLDIIRNTYGQNNGVATLGSDGKLPSSQLPDLADDVIVVDSYSTLPAIGTASKIYITADNNKGYRWDPELTTPDYVKIFEIDKSIVFGYYSSGSFYEDFEHTIQITPEEKVLYVDVSMSDIFVLEDGVLIELLASKYAKVADIQDGTITAGLATKAWQDAMGNAIITTYATKSELTSEATERANADTDLKSAIDKNTAEIENLKQTSAQTEITVSYPDDGNYSALMPNLVPAKSAKYAEVKSIVGKSRAWNQMIPISVLPPTDNVIQNNNDGSYTVLQSPSSAYTPNISPHNSVIQNHVYYISDGLNLFDSSLIGSTGINGTIFKALGSGTISTERVVVMPNTPVGTKIWVFMRDLTIIFPEYTANEIISLGVSGLLKLCPDLLKYDAYGTSIVDTTVTGVKTTSINIWDEQGRNGRYNNDTGAYFDDGNNRWCNLNPIPVEPSTQYYRDVSLISNVYFYDINMTYLGYVSTGANPFPTPNNCRYINFNTVASYGTTYKNNLQICLNSASEKTIYHPHNLDTLSLPSPVTLRSAGSVAETFDLETGKKTNPLGSVDLGTLAWGYLDGRFYTSIDDIVNDTNNVNLLCAKYATGMRYSAVDKTIYRGNYILTKQINVNDSAYTSVGSASDPTTFLGHLQGFMLYYELATPDDPTQLTPVTNNTLKVEPNGTVETVQTQSPVLDNSMTVNFDLIP